MKSWRFIFIDENESFTISTTQTTIIGYCVIRAPKGTTEATFFEAGNASAIQAMIGVGTSDWPDVKEAIAFNNSAVAAKNSAVAVHNGAVTFKNNAIQLPFRQIRQPI